MIRVLHSVSVMNRAGQETFLMNVYRRINRELVQFDFQCSIREKGDFDSEIEELGGEILYLDQNCFNISFLRYLGIILQQYKFFKSHSEYKIFHIHTYHAFDAWLAIVGAKLGGAERIFLHSHNTQGLHPVLHKLFRVFLKYMRIERCACSKKAAIWMFGENQIERVSILNNGIEPEQFKFNEKERQKKRSELGLQDNLVVGHIGRFNYQKNHSFLVDVFFEIKKLRADAKLILVGNGELCSEIREKVINLGLNNDVLFLGVREDIRELLWAMDIFIFPSLFEGLSVVTIEAQATGVPMLLSDSISKETKITDCITFLSLKQPSSKWAHEAICLTNMDRKDTSDAIEDAGYSIIDTAKILEQKYSNL